MKRTLMITVAVLGLTVAGGMTAGTVLPSAAQSVSAQAAVTKQQATFAIENMTCALCPLTVKAAMEKVTGVKSVAVNFDAQTATVVFDPSKATIAEIAAASTNAGYPASTKK